MNIIFKKESTREKFSRKNNSYERLRKFTCTDMQTGINYIPVPKAACSTLKLFMHLRNGGTLEEARNIHKSIYLNIDKKSVKEILDRKSINFTFVRDPEARIISCYKQKIYRKDSQFMELQYKINSLNGKSDIPISFSDFIQYIYNQDVLDMNPHWRPQWSILCVDFVKYKFIGKIENFINDFSRFSNYYALEIPNNFSVSKKRNNTNKIDIYQNITKEDKRLINKIYKRDYKIFKYPRS